MESSSAGDGSRYAAGGGIALTGVQMNGSMRLDAGLNTLCGGGSNGTGGGGGAVCDRGSLGISLSTPIIMMTTGVLGNLLALLVLFTADKQVRRTAFFPFLVTVACSDLVGQFAMGIVAVVMYSNNLKWVGGRPLCIYHGFAMVFFAVITPLLVCSMSVERMLALRFSFFYERHFTNKVAKIIILVSVVFTFFFCTWPLMGFGSYEHQFPGSWCFLNFHRESLSDVVYATVFSLLNIAIIAAIVVCNLVVGATVLKLRWRRRTRLHTSPSVEISQQVGVRPRARSRLSPLHLEMETQMAWFLLAITVVFSCLWLPINVHILLNQITGKIDYRQDLISVRLASINQIIDPWLYVILRKSTVIKLLRRLKNLITSSTHYHHHQQQHHGHPRLSSNSATFHHHNDLHRDASDSDQHRRRSCPPAVLYSVHNDGCGLVLADQASDHLLSSHDNVVSNSNVPLLGAASGLSHDAELNDVTDNAGYSAHNDGCGSLPADQASDHVLSSHDVVVSNSNIPLLGASSGLRHDAELNDVTDNAGYSAHNDGCGSLPADQASDHVLSSHDVVVSNSNIPLLGASSGLRHDAELNDVTDNAGYSAHNDGCGDVLADQASDHLPSSHDVVDSNSNIPLLGASSGLRHDAELNDVTDNTGYSVHNNGCGDMLEDQASDHLLAHETVVNNGHSPVLGVSSGLRHDAGFNDVTDDAGCELNVCLVDDSGEEVPKEETSLVQKAQSRLVKEQNVFKMSAIEQIALETFEIEQRDLECPEIKQNVLRISDNTSNVLVNSDMEQNVMVSSEIKHTNLVSSDMDNNVSVNSETEEKVFVSPEREQKVRSSPGMDRHKDTSRVVNGAGSAGIQTELRESRVHETDLGNTSTGVDTTGDTQPTSNSSLQTGYQGYQGIHNTKDTANSRQRRNTRDSERSVEHEDSLGSIKEDSLGGEQRYRRVNGSVCGAVRDGSVMNKDCDCGTQQDYYVTNIDCHCATQKNEVVLNVVSENNRHNDSYPTNIGSQNGQHRAENSINTNANCGLQNDHSVNVETVPRTHCNPARKDLVVASLDSTVEPNGKVSNGYTLLNNDHCMTSRCNGVNQEV